ncbi:hypothetical protein HK102_012279, partial [Quaeritorhiza haematococci]
MVAGQFHRNNNHGGLSKLAINISGLSSSAMAGFNNGAFFQRILTACRNAARRSDCVRGTLVSGPHAKAIKLLFGAVLLQSLSTFMPRLSSRGAVAGGLSRSYGLRLDRAERLETLTA